MLVLLGKAYDGIPPSLNGLSEYKDMKQMTGTLRISYCTLNRVVCQTMHSSMVLVEYYLGVATNLVAQSMVKPDYSTKGEHTVT